MKKKGISFRSRFDYLILIVLAILLYGNTLNHEFALDDGLMIRDNRLTQEGISGIPDILFSDQFVGISGENGTQLFSGSRYRPLSQIIFALEYEIAGLNPAFMHRVHLFFYILLILVIYRTLRNLLPQGKEKFYFTIPFWASIVFLMHPLHTEVVANLKSLDEILALLFGMLALHSSILSFDQKKWYQAWISGIFFLLGVLSKENSLTFAAIIPLSLYIFRNIRAKENLKIWLSLGLFTGLYFLLRYLSLGFIMSSNESDMLFHNPFLFVDTITKYSMIVYTWGKYLWMLFVPYPLTHDYYPFMIPEVGLSNIWVIISVILYLALVAGAIYLSIKKNIIGYAIGFYLLSFSMVSNLVFNLGILFNERLLFMPSLGFAIAFGLGITVLLKRYSNQKVGFAMIGIVLLFYAVIIIDRNPDWKNDRTLFYADVKTSGESARVNVVAGTLKVLEGKEVQNSAERERLYEEGSDYIRKGLKLYANNPAGWQALGDIAWDRKNYLEAFRLYTTASTYDSLNQGLVNNQYACAYKALEEKPLEALEIAGELLRRDSSEVDHHLFKAEVLLKTENPGAAVAYLEEREKLFEKQSGYLNKLAEYNARYLNDQAKSGSYLFKAYAVDSSNIQTLENLCVYYGMQGDYQKALNYSLKAFHTGKYSTNLINNLINTYLYLGMPDEAEKYRRFLK